MTKLTCVSNSIKSSYSPCKQNTENILKSIIQYYLLLISWNRIFNQTYKLAHGKGETIENIHCIPCTTWQQIFNYRFNSYLFKRSECDRQRKACAGTQNNWLGIKCRKKSTWWRPKQRQKKEVEKVFL